MERLLYSPYDLACIICEHKMSVQKGAAFLKTVWQKDNTFLQERYRDDLKKLYLDENIFIEENEEINKILPKIIKYLKNNNKSTEYNIERRRKSGIYYFDNEGIAIFYQKEFNKKIVEKIDISLPYEDSLNILDIGKILNIEILKQIL